MVPGRINEMEHLLIGFLATILLLIRDGLPRQ
jgi:hypothetical protein